jgi:acetyl esterase/lipase
MRFFLALHWCVLIHWLNLAIATEPMVIPLWPEGAPEKPGFVAEPEQETVKADGLKRITQVSQPTLTLFQPSHPNGTVILICPGGGYQGLAFEHEGTQVAEYLNTLGVTGAVLKYRVPRRDPLHPHEAPMADAIRAIQILRSRSDELGIRGNRLGILGFSAGGNLSVLTALQATDQHRPNFLVAIYPAYLTQEKDEFRLRPEIVVPPSAPPACFIHAGDDRITAAGSALLYLDYKKLGIPAELHIYSQGGHGFGMKKNGSPANQWHVRVSEWLTTNGWLSSSAVGK